MNKKTARRLAELETLQNKLKLEDMALADPELAPTLEFDSCEACAKAIPEA